MKIRKKLPDIEPESVLLKPERQFIEYNTGFHPFTSSNLDHESAYNTKDK